MRNAWIPLTVLTLLASSLAAQEMTDRTIAGKVVDEKGQPLAGAKVNCYRILPDPQARIVIREANAATTGADGKFSFTAARMGGLAVVVTARKDGLAWAWQDWEGRPGEGVGEAVLTLGAPVALSGVVVDEANNPVAGAVLRPMLESGSDEDGPRHSRHMIGMEPADWMMARTDAAGKFQFAFLPAGAKAEFIVDAPGKGRIATMGNMSSLQYAAGQTGIRITVKAEGKIEGTLARKDGKPVAGATVLALQHSFADEFMTHSAITDKDGKFTIAGLEGGEYRLETRGAKTVPDFIASKEGVQVASGKTVSGAALEAHVGGLLRVTVTDDKGKPIPGARVSMMRQISPNSYSGGPGAPADGNGVATWRLDPGTVTVSAEADDFQRSHFAPGEEIVIEEGMTADVKVQLSPMQKIKGLVKDVEGKPVEGATARLRGEYAWPPSSARTDANGHFSLGYELQGSPPDPKVKLSLMLRHADRGLAAVAEVADPNKPLEITLKLGAALKGVVVDEDGKPMAKVKVSASLAQSGERRMAPYGMLGERMDAVTDAQGRYQIKAMPPGQYAVSVAVEGFAPGGADAEAAEGKTEVEVDKIALKAAKLSITGTVTDANAQPVAGAAIYLGGEGQTRKGNLHADKSGKFVIDKLVEGEVHLMVSDGAGQRADAVFKAGEKDVEIVVQPPGREKGGQPENVPPSGGPKAPKGGGEDF